MFQNSTIFLTFNKSMFLNPEQINGNPKYGTKKAHMRFVVVDLVNLSTSLGNLPFMDLLFQSHPRKLSSWNQESI